MKKGGPITGAAFFHVHILKSRRHFRMSPFSQRRRRVKLFKKSFTKNFRDFSLLRVVQTVLQTRPLNSEVDR